MENIMILSIEQVQAIRACYERAKPVAMLDPEPPFGSRKLIEVDTERMLQQGAQPWEYARQVMVVHDPDEAERLAHLDSDIALLCQMALELHEQLMASPP